MAAGFKLILFVSTLLPSSLVRSLIVIIVTGAPYQLTLPENLSPGGYLLRHEIIALQLAVSVGGAEFYPSCTQLLVGGSGNGQPNATVTFPGAYSDTDPGIYDPDVSRSVFCIIRASFDPIFSSGLQPGLELYLPWSRGGDSRR
jgi:hypothetical protein